MTDKITLNNLAVFDPSIITTINSNNAAITTAINNTLSRDGTSPNPMVSALDMNSNHILNLPPASSPTEPVRLQDLTNGIVGPAGPIGPAGTPLNNTRIAKTANYTAISADSGSTFSLGGNSVFTLTFSAASGYASNFIVLAVNTDTAAAKTIALAGLTSFFLWPGQTILIYNDNNVWRSTGPYRWQLTGTSNFYVDPVNGSDSNDGLAPGTGRAFQHLGFAISFLQTQLMLNGSNPNINLANGTYNESFTVFGGFVGGVEATIVGNPSSPSSVVFNGTFACRDQGILTINGVKFTSSAAQCILIGQLFVLDLMNIEFGACPSGVHIQVNPGGYVNYNGGTYVVSGNALVHIAMNGQGGVFQILSNPQVVSLPSALTFTDWISNQSGYTGFSSGVTFTGAGAGSGSTGTKYSVTYNGVTVLSGATLPGATAGTFSTGGQVAA